MRHLLLCLVIALPACSAQEKAALERAKTGAKVLGNTLGLELSNALKTGSVPDAFTMCAGNAQAMTQRIAEEEGVTVGRSSLRLRNPANAGPDWVTAWLEEQGERSVNQAEGFERIDSTSEGKFARFIKPIGIKPECLNCHGERDKLADEVAAKLAEHYPNDAATGYAVGDLRGAIWAEVKVGG